MFLKTIKMEIKCFVSLLYPHNKYHKKKINILLKNIEEIKKT